MIQLTLPMLLAMLAPMVAPLQMAIHTRLARSEPAAASVVGESPRELRLWFEGGIEARFTQIALLAGNGARLALGAPTHGREGGLVVVPVPLALPADRYTVTWETVGRDGHPVRGDFSFTVSGTGAAPARAAAPAAMDSAAWGAGTAGRTVTGNAVAAPDLNAESTRSPAQFAPESRPMRWAELATLVVALGAVALLLLVLRTEKGGPAHERFVALASRRVRSLGLIAAVLFLVVSGARFALESRVMHGGRAGLTAEALGATATTAWGRSWMVAVVAMVVLLAALVARRFPDDAATRRRPSRGTDLALGGAALLTAIGPAMTGHAASAVALMPLAVLADWLHVIGASAWIGGITGLAVAAAPAALAQEPGERAPAMAWLVGAFHAVAVPAITLVALSGLGSGWMRVGSWSALTSSNYGELLLFKVYIVAFTALIGAYHWFRVHPRLAAAAASDDRAARQLGWTLYIELLVGFVVVALTAALVTTPPPR